VTDHNGSKRHQRYKQRVANVCRQYGFQVFGDQDNEVEISREQTYPFYIDLLATNGTRILAIEIDGPKNHSSHYAKKKDANRLDYIKQKLGPRCETYRFGFWQLAGTSDELIAEELKLKLV